MTGDVTQKPLRKMAIVVWIVGFHRRTVPREVVGNHMASVLCQEFHHSRAAPRMFERSRPTMDHQQRSNVTHGGQE